MGKYVPSFILEQIKGASKSRNGEVDTVGKTIHSQEGQRISAVWWDWESGLERDSRPLSQECQKEVARHQVYVHWEQA